MGSACGLWDTRLWPSMELGGMVTACEELERAASSGSGTIQVVCMSGLSFGCKVKELQKSCKKASSPP